MRGDLLDQAKQLGVSERIELAEAIWDTVDERIGVDDLAVPEAHQAELDSRLARLSSEHHPGAPSDEVGARLHKER